jgi:branched-chain amino acid transport system permease protein
MSYFLHVLVLISIYTILASSLNLLAGCTGMLSVAHAAFYGLGAYAGALAALHWSIGFPFDLAVACGLGALVALVAALPSLRVHGDYFVLGTFALQMIVFNLLNNWTAVTGGAIGMGGIRSPSVFGISIASPLRYLCLAGPCAAVVVWVLMRISQSSYGKVIRAIRDDELLAETLGTDVHREKTIVFVLTAAMAAGAGSLYANYITFIAPSNFTVQESIFLLAIVIIGGAGNFLGSVIGAAVLVAVPELLRFFDVSSAAAANVRQIMYGALLVFVMIARPRGLLGEYDFRR